MSESEHKDELERSLEDARRLSELWNDYDADVVSQADDAVSDDRKATDGDIAHDRSRIEAAVRADARARDEAEPRCWCGLPESAPDHRSTAVEREGSDGLGVILYSGHPFEDGHDTYERARVLPAGSLRWATLVETYRGDKDAAGALMEIACAKESEQLQAALARIAELEAALVLGPAADDLFREHYSDHAELMTNTRRHLLTCAVCHAAAYIGRKQAELAASPVPGPAEEA